MKVYFPTIAGIVNEIPGRHTSTRAISITNADAAKLLKITLENPVVLFRVCKKIRSVKFGRSNGLDLAKDKDWYRHYFRDMMTWLSRNKLSDEGIKPLDKQPSEKTSLLNMTMSDVWRSVVEFLR